MPTKEPSKIHHKSLLPSQGGNQSNKPRKISLNKPSTMPSKKLSTKPRMKTSKDAIEGT
jgi:hypothetical protein